MMRFMIIRATVSEKEVGHLGKPIRVRENDFLSFCVFSFSAC
jgi:hypothetical protein